MSVFFVDSIRAVWGGRARKKVDFEREKAIDVVILAGGKGTRVKEIIRDRPKPMVEVNGKPFLDILIGYARRSGFRRFILCVGHMADFIEDYYTKKDSKEEILFSFEKRLLGTGGAIKNAEKMIETNSFIVMNGDSFCPVNLGEFINFHKSKRAILSMVITQEVDTGDYGTLIIDNSNKIIGYQEKDNEPGRTYINAGIYLFEREVLSMIPAALKYSLEYELFPKLVGREFYGFPVSKAMIDIGTPGRLASAGRFFSD